MTNDRLTIRTYKDIANGVRSRFFPRRLITDRNRMEGILRPVFDTLLQLNKITYKPRFFELSLQGNHMDLTQITIPGIRVKRVLDITPMSTEGSIFSLYERMMYGQPIFFNLIRNQDNFTDYIFSREVYRQIEQRYQNQNYNFEQVGDKVIMGQHWIGTTTKGIVIFIPYYDETPGTDVVVTSESVGTTNGNATTFQFYLKQPFIKPGTVNIVIGATTITDDGESNLSGGNFTGTVNYSNGEVILTAAVAPAAAAVVASYTQLNYTWEFSGKEYSFFIEYLDALVSFREGRAQSELMIADVQANTDVLTQAEDKLENIVKKYMDTSFSRVGRKF